MAITLNQIAEICGVSRGTVDRALHNKGNVRPAVAERIKAVAAEYGYTPNRAGLALSRTSHPIRTASSSPPTSARPPPRANCTKPLTRGLLTA